MKIIMHLFIIVTFIWISGCGVKSQQPISKVDDYQLPISREGKFKEHLSRGETYLKLEKYDKALSEYGKLIEIKPSYVEAYYNVGLIYENTNQLVKAIEEYENVLKLEPSHINALAKLGEIYYRQKDYEKAIAYFKNIILLDSKNQHAYDALISIYERKILIDSQNADLLIELGDLHTKTKDYENAEKYYLRVLEIDDANTTAIFNLGILHIQTEDYAKSTKAFRNISEDSTYYLRAKEQIEIIKKLKEEKVWDDFKAKISPITYLNALKSPISHKDKVVEWTGKITSIKERDWSIDVWFGKTGEKTSYKGRTFIWVQPPGTRGLDFEVICPGQVEPCLYDKVKVIGRIIGDSWKNYRGNTASGTIILYSEHNLVKKQ